MDESIKQAFSRVKEDIFYLGNELQQIKLELADLRTELKLISSYIENLKVKNFLNPAPTDKPKTPTIPTHIPTHPETPTDNLAYNALKTQNTAFSTGNGGVPTDRQTDQQTDRHILQHKEKFALNNDSSSMPSPSTLSKATEILENLDAIKKELRLKLKRLTPQEMSIFSLIYSLEEQGQLVDYRLLSAKTNLSESSIRDYALKISSKGLPLLKEKLNNKRILLHISPDLKKLATLETLNKLREI